MGRGIFCFVVFHVLFWFLVLVPMFVLVFVLVLFVSSISSVHCRNSKLGCFFNRVSPFRSLNSIKLRPTSGIRGKLQDALAIQGEQSEQEQRDPEELGNLARRLRLASVIRFSQFS